METYLIYIGKAAIAAGAFYIAFLVLFQNQKHFTFNRIYLPVSLALSFVIPLITFTTIKYIEPVNFDVNSFAYLTPASGEIAQPAFVFEWYDYLFGLYLLGTAGFLFHLLLGHLKAINIIQKSRVQKIFDNLVNITQKDVHPFSFFSKIVVSEKTLSHPELKIIVSHENIHVREKHTLDILLTEIMFLFQWFNPFAWLLKDAVKNNLEYLTDHQIAKLYNVQTYQLAMVTLADKQGIAPFLTALNGSQLKNRIVMMKKKTENKYGFLKQLVVLPLLAVLVMGLSNRDVKTEVIQNNNQNEISGSEILIKGKVTDQKGDPISGASVIVKGTTTGTITDSNGNYELQLSNENKTLSFLVPDFEPLNIDVNGQNTIDVQLKSDNSSKNSVVKVTTSGTHDFTLEKEDENIVSDKVPNENREPPSGANAQIKDRHESDTTAKSDTIEVTGNVSYESRQSQPGGYEISGGLKGTVQKGSDNITIIPSSQNGLTIKTTGGQTGQPLYLVDGVETIFLNKLSPDSIESISVLKDKSATILYGEKGKNGVILITTKKYGQNNKSGNVTVGYGNNAALLGNPAPFGSATGKTIQPLILVNGKETWQKVNDIDPETIQSVNVLKDETATKKYGDKGKNGVIEITLKNREKIEPAKVSENEQVIGNINWINNEKYSSKELTNILGIKKGDEYSKEIIEERMYGNISSLYMDNGYLFFNITVTEKQKNDNTIDLEFKIIEGNRAKIGKIEITGITEGSTNEILNKIEIRSGDLFSRIKLIQSVTTLNELIKPNSEVEDVDVNPLTGSQENEFYIVNLVFKIKGNNGEILNTTKKYSQTSEITSALELRQSIARNIKYPVVAQENNQQGVVDIWAFIEKDGTISRITDKRPDGNFINVDEVVVTSLKSEKAVTSEKSNNLELLVKESKRVIEQLSPLKIPELQGEMACFRIKFVLQ